MGFNTRVALKEELEAAGNWLFRWRGHLPVLLFLLVFAALKDPSYSGHDHARDYPWELSCFLISLSGLALRVWTAGQTAKGTSGRNTREQRAEVLNTTGVYSAVRHPLYLGNAAVWLGISLVPRVFWLPCVTMLVFWLYYERIMLAEEEFLRRKFGESFTRWAEATPAFIPRFDRWRPPAQPFRARYVLERETQGLFGLIAAFTALEAVRDAVVLGRFELACLWQVLFGVGLVLYLSVVALKKTTRVLDVAER